MGKTRTMAWLFVCVVSSPGLTLAAEPEWTAKVTSNTIRVTGTADLPDKAFFYVRASFSKTVFARGKATVEGGRFDVTLGPFDRELWAGEYTLDVQLLPGRQPEEVSKKAKLKPLRLKKTVRFGSKKLEASQEQERRTHYTQSVWAAREHLERLLDYFCACSRTLPGFVGDEGREAWRNWLVVWHLPSTDAEEATKQLERWQTPVYFVTKAGDFDPKAWRKWIDTFRESLVDALNRHRTFLAKHAAAKYPRSSQNVELMFATLTKMSARYSAALFKGKAIPVHVKDRSGNRALPNAPKGADMDHFRQLLRAIHNDTGI